MKYKLVFYHNSEGYRDYGDYDNYQDAVEVKHKLYCGSSCLNGRFEIIKILSNMIDYIDPITASQYINPYQPYDRGGEYEYYRRLVREGTC